MDNTKTGSLIKTLRKEKGLTQKALADQLSITDRAVSKWERGICAPDIALLEPLSQILGCTVLELISGERTAQVDLNTSDQLSEHETPRQLPTYSAEKQTKQLITYSVNEISRKTKRLHRRYLLSIGIFCVLLLIAIVGGIYVIQKSGALYIIDKKVSPNQQYTATVYSRNTFLDGTNDSNRISVATRHKDDTGFPTVADTYSSTEYLGLWWSPDSSKYVIVTKNEHSATLELYNLQTNSRTHLNVYLETAIKEARNQSYKDIFTTFFPRDDVYDVNYEFLQWSKDSKSMLIYYSYEDMTLETRDGYFWYNHESHSIAAAMEMS